MFSLNTEDIKWEERTQLPLHISEEIFKLLCYSGWQTCAGGSDHSSGETDNIWELLYRSGWKNAEVI